MILSNETLLDVFLSDLDRYYVPYSDLLSHGQYGDGQQMYFAKNNASFAAGQWICVTVNEDEVLLDIESDTAVLNEAITYAKTQEKPLLLRLDNETAARISSHFDLYRKNNSGYEHHGVFGGVNSRTILSDTNTLVRHATAEDTARITILPISEWGAISR